MDSSELRRIERQTRWRYEWSRARRALLGFAPATILVALAVTFAARPLLTMTFGVLLFLWGAVLLWQGRELKRSVLPGVGAGLLPLSLAICANRIGHVCLEGSCTMLCVPACTVGGLGAGILLSRVGRGGRHGLGVWMAASATALLTGAMGCICIGSAGLAGLLLGYSVGSAPLLLRLVFAGK